MIEVLLVDDNPIVRAAVRGFLDASDAALVVGEAGDGRAGLAAARRLRPDVTLLDYRMPVADGLSVIEAMSTFTAVLVLTSDSDAELIAAMLRGGARGYLVHGQFEPDELLRAVVAVADGQGWLSSVAASVATSFLRRQVVDEREESARTARRSRVRQGYALTRREEDVANLLCHGLSNAAIAHRLLLTEKTVKNHLNNIFAKLGAANRTEAALRWAGSELPDTTS